MTDQPASFEASLSSLISLNGREIPNSMAKDRTRLDELDQSKKLDQDEYKKLLKKHQLELLNAQLVLRESQKSLIVVFEGPDAAGKGGAIKRLVERLDPARAGLFHRQADSGGISAPLHVALLEQAAPHGQIPSLIARGTGACWSSGSKNFAQEDGMEARLS